VRWGWPFAGLDFVATAGPDVWLTALATAAPPELSRGSKPFANGSGRSARRLEMEVQGVVSDGLVTYRAQGWAAISAWSWVVL
jgi:hypothetical protein